MIKNNFGTSLEDYFSFANVKTVIDKFDRLLKGTKFPPLLRNAKLVLGTFAVLIFFLLIFLIRTYSTSKVNIPVYKVTRGNFLVSITESGDIRAKNSTSIVTPRVQGNLKIIYMVPEGTYIHAGDTVIKFDPTEALTNLQNAQAKLEMTESDRAELLANQKSMLTNLKSALKSVELSFELSKLNLDQMKFEANIKQLQAKLENEKDQLSLNKAKQELESQKIIQKSELSKMDLQVQQDKASLQKAQRDLAALTITAPKEGLVVYETNWSSGRKLMIGDTPSPGMPLVSLPDLSTMQSITYVNEVDISRVKNGQNVIVKLDAFQDSTFKGIISSVALLGRSEDNNSNIKVFEVDVDIQSHSALLKPGMTTSNQIIFDKIQNAIYIPRESVFNKEGERIVYLKDGTSFKDQEVETGEKSENYIVISKGLQPHEEVALIDPTLNSDRLEINNSRNNTSNFPAMIK